MRSAVILATAGVAVDRLLLSVAVIVAVAWAAGTLLRRVGQPPVLGEILAGILLGPSVVGAAWPWFDALLFPPAVLGGLRAIAELGLVLFMFLVGIEVDLSLVRGSGKRAVVMSAASTAVPMAMGVLVSPVLVATVAEHARQPGFALFIGTAMGITAFPVLARLLQQMGLDGSPAGVLAIACAAIGDVGAWCVLAVTVAVIEASGLRQVAIAIFGGFAFAGLVLGVLRPMLRRNGTIPLPVAVALAFLGAWTTSWIGIHAIFGAFLVGLAMPRSGNHAGWIGSRLEAATTTILLPVFFVVAGLSVDIRSLGSWSAVAATAVIIVVAVLGKVGGVALAARSMRMPWDDAVGLGVLMNTRGLTEIVILTVGLQLGVIDEAVFSAMVLMALVTTFMAAPVLEATGTAGRWRSAQVGS